MLTWFRVVLVVFLLIGVLSLAIQVSHVNSGNLIEISPVVSGCWMALLITLTAISGLILDKRNSFVKNHSQSLKIFYIVQLVLSTSLTIGFAVGYRPGPAIHAFLLWVLQLVLYLSCKELSLEIDLNNNEIYTFQEKFHYIELSLTSSEDIVAPLAMVPAMRSTRNSDSTVLYLDEIFAVISSLVLIFSVLLQVGCWIQAIGYRVYRPDGQFITIEYPSGHKQRILAQCVGPVREGLSTLWMEVGGGGHSMSDLWGLRDTLVKQYGRRYCSYDMPGTGWSDPVVPNQPVITKQVMDALNERGPFVMLGSMDDGHVRAYQFALDYPDLVTAVVPINFNNDTEFTSTARYYGYSHQETVDLARSTYLRRMLTGDVYNFFGVSWGLIELVIKPDPLYQPAERGLENLFLNLYNEKQWVTNCNFLYNGYMDPVGSGLLSYSLYSTNPNLDPRIPIIGFALAQSDEQLVSQCLTQGLAPDSPQCGFIFDTYYSNLKFNQNVVSRNPLSKLILCYNCYAPYGNGFIINQYSNIPWFSQNLIESLDALGV